MKSLNGRYKILIYMENKLVELVILVFLIGLNFFAFLFPFYKDVINKKPSIDLSKKIEDHIKSN